MSTDRLVYRDWIGGSERVEDAMASEQVQRLAATLDVVDMDFSAGVALPPLWHWVYFLSAARHSNLGSDGHPARGGFLPPIELPRRMFAGSEVEFHSPLTIGTHAVRSSEVIKVDEKQGRSGPLCFVSVQHRITQHDRPCISETQQIVYRDGSIRPELYAGSGPPPRAANDWTAELTPDPVLLFRFSALTFNAHRIHYDQSYATGAEHYPGLVVHAPLTALLLAELMRNNTRARVRRLEFRALAPLIAGQTIFFTGQIQQDASIELEAIRSDGRCAMRGSATLYDE